ncbi:MAG TPA: hypothetical protein VNG33_07815, partial [Polyangiaceae bacterium]|nr:hypothetical protein [Polyangiaceae bacterium]
MAKRPQLVWGFGLVLAAFAGCSFDSRTLHVTDGLGGADASGGTSSGAATGGTATSGAATSAGEPGVAGKMGSSGSAGTAGTTSTEGGAVGLGAGEVCKVDG